MSDLCMDLANFIVQTKYDDLPAAVVHDTKFLILDSIGCALAGISIDPGKMAIALARKMGGPPEASVIGTGDKVSCSAAALTNGDLIRAPDYDAMLPGGHAPEHIIPPPLAIAESTGASGEDLVLATALGFEVAARVTSGQQGGSAFSRPDVEDFRVAERVSILPSCNLGAAAGAGKLLNLNQDKMMNALGIAGYIYQPSTFTRQTYGAHRSMLKYGVTGWQNLGGVMAVWLADMGYMGDTTLFDAKNEPWKFIAFEGWQPDRVIEGLGKTWTFTKVNYKPYPCCRMLHSALDCFYRIIDQNKLMPEDIESVKAWGNPCFDWPLFTNRELTNVVDVQFGLHYILAIAAHRVKIGIEWQDLEMVKKPEILEFSKKVSFQSHPEFLKQQREVPGSHIGKVEVVSKSKTFIEETVYSKGTPNTEFALSDDELVEKFKHNASRILTQDKIEGAVNMILNLEKVENARELMQQVTL